MEDSVVGSRREGTGREGGREKESVENWDAIFTTS